MIEIGQNKMISLQETEESVNLYYYNGPKEKFYSLTFPENEPTAR